MEGNCKNTSEEKCPRKYVRAKGEGRLQAKEVVLQPLEEVHSLPPSRKLVLAAQ
jgi:hypothetical protein